jgi:hypothetical protein
MTQELEKLIDRDVAFCAAMTDEMDAYIKSDVLFWEPNRGRLGAIRLPKLTFGGLFLALRRLQTLHDRLDLDQKEVLVRAERELAFQKKQWPPRYEGKLARELRSRLDEWAWYLDDCREQGERAIAHYPHRAEVRVKIDLLLDAADEITLDVVERRRRQAALDERLVLFFAVGEFCWVEELAAGFPPDRFWFLYGFPREN